MAQTNAPSAQLTGGPKQIQISLLAKVLEQDSPTITYVNTFNPLHSQDTFLNFYRTKMLPFLLQEGVADLIINFIVRVDPSSLPANTGNTPEECKLILI